MFILNINIAFYIYFLFPQSISKHHNLLFAIFKCVNMIHLECWAFGTKIIKTPSILQINFWTCLKSVTSDIKFWWNKGTLWIIFESKRKHVRLEINSLVCLKNKQIWWYKFNYVLRPDKKETMHIAVFCFTHMIYK